MGTRRQLITSDEAQLAAHQHQAPCSDCPFSRQALPGWLGRLTAEEWMQVAHGDGWVGCPVFSNQQCAGAAIYRANVCKLPRIVQLQLPPDREHVFASPRAFLDHHQAIRRTRCPNRRRRR